MLISYLLATSKTLCSVSFKLRTLDPKKKTQKTVAKWKVDLYRFYRKTEFANTALIISDTKPRLIVCIFDIDNTTLFIRLDQCCGCK